MRTMRRVILLFAALLALPWQVLLARAADDAWPQFRGPDGQGHAASAQLPLTWSETQNIKWKFADPGQGWSSPVISGERIWMTTPTEGGKSLRVLSLDLAHGNLLKDIEVFHREVPIAKQEMNSYATPSPVVETGRLFVSFGTCGTACLSTETGAILWRREDIRIEHEVGPSSSPVLAKNKLIIPFDGKDLQFILALDKQTGQTIWNAARSFVDGRRPYPAHSCCTPLVVPVNGADQVVVPGAQRTFAYDLATGKELWWVTHGGWSIVPRPVFGNGLVYTTTGYNAPDRDSALMAIRPDGHGEVTESKVAWRVTRHVPMMPSPVLVSNRLFAVTDDAGTAYCLDALTGADVWRQRIGGKYSASPLAAPGRIYLFDRDGTTVVVEAADSFRLLARNKLESGCMASAAVAGRALILRTKSHLYRIEE